MTPATDRNRSESGNLPRVWRHQESPGLWIGLGLGSIGLHALLLFVVMPLSMKLTIGGSAGSTGAMTATSIELIDLPASNSNASNSNASIAITPSSNASAALSPSTQAPPAQIPPAQIPPIETAIPETAIGFSSLPSIDPVLTAPLMDDWAIATSAPSPAPSSPVPTPTPTLPPRLESSLPLTPAPTSIPTPTPTPTPAEHSTLDNVVPPISQSPVSQSPVSQTEPANSTIATSLNNSQLATPQPTDTPQPATPQPAPSPTDKPGRLPEPPVLPEVPQSNESPLPTDATVDVNQAAPVDPVLLVSLQVVSQTSPSIDAAGAAAPSVSQPAQLLSLNFEFTPDAETCRAHPEAFDFLGTPIGMKLSIDATGQITGEEPIPPPAMEQIRYYQLVRCILKNAAKFQSAIDTNGVAIADQMTISITLTRSE